MDFSNTWNTLCSLSIAEVDYQLRKYLLTPANANNLVRMFQHIIALPSSNQMQVNVMLMRSLELIGSDLFSEEIKEEIRGLLEMIG